MGIIIVATAGAAAVAAVPAAEKAMNTITKKGHYANGDWIHVHGDIKKNEPYSAWKPMYFEK